MATAEPCKPIGPVSATAMVTITLPRIPGISASSAHSLVMSFPPSRLSQAVTERTGQAVPPSQLSQAVTESTDQSVQPGHGRSSQRL